MQTNDASNEASTLPPAPQDRMRRATMDDLPRLALVTMSAFYHVPQFAWERPYHHQYPEDTYRSYYDRLRAHIADPACLVYLVEDWYDASEHTKTGATIATGGLYHDPQPGERVPVGLGLWVLPVDSSCRRLPPASSNLISASAPPDLTTTTTLGRDVHTAHHAQLRAKVGEVRSRLFADGESARYVMNMFVVHPAYQGRGHGTAILRFGAECADGEGRAIRIFAQPKAVPLYEREGFELLDWAGVEDGEMKFHVAAMVRLPGGREGSSS